MSRNPNDVVHALEQAARSADEQEFDAALDELLEQARSEATPAPTLRALIDERVRGELARPMHAGGTPSTGGMRLAATLASGVRRIAPRPRGWARIARGLGLVAVGVAIGFVWGRAPRTWPGDRETEPRAAQASTEASQAQPRAIVELAPGVQPELPSARESNDAQSVKPDAPTPATSAGAVSEAASSNARAAGAAASMRKAASAHDRARSGGADSLRFVLEQLRKAQLFLRAGEPARAIAALDVLDAHVPGPVLQEEREVTRTLALCDSGETALASSLAQRVLARSPDSAYAVSLRESCAGKAQLLEEIRERTSNPRP